MKYLLPILVLLCLTSCEEGPELTTNAPEIKLLEYTELHNTKITLNGELKTSDVSSIKEIGFIVGTDASLDENTTTYPIDIGDLTANTAKKYSIVVEDLYASLSYFYVMYATNGITTMKTDIKEVLTLTNSKPFVIVGNILISDRNAGVSVPTDGVALNYTDDEDHPDHKNLLFKGDNYTWDEAQTVCPSGWRLPTKTELDTIDSKMQFSNGTAYLSDVNDNRCYFPLSTYYSYYWSSTENYSDDAWRLSLSTSSSSVGDSRKSSASFVRCVKPQVSVTTKVVTNIEATTATFNGNVTSDVDIIARGFVYSTTTTTPTLEDDSYVAVGSGTGDFIYDITDLRSSTIYNVRAYATTSKGTFYGDVNTFDTPPISVPIVVDNILVSDRNAGTNVSTDGTALNYTNDSDHADHNNLSFKGDYYTWDEAQTACASGWRLPTKDELVAINSKMLFSDGRAYLLDAKKNRCYFPLSGYLNSSSIVYGHYWSSTVSGNGNDNAWRLNINVNYGRVYYEDKSNGFSVRCVKPQSRVITKDVTNIEATTATLNGNVSADVDIIARGFVYSTTTTTPILDNDSYIAVGSGVGDFIYDITDLTSATTYNVRAYATTSKGTFYGDINTFGTLSISVPIVMGNILISDRNAGSSVPTDGSALNYTNDEDHADNKNLSFKGDYYTWDEAQTACASGWRLPTKDELVAIDSEMLFSDGRAYLMDANDNRCYFPLSSYSSSSSGMYNGYYWSSTEYSSYVWRLNIHINYGGMDYGDKSNGFSVRCVKPQVSIITKDATNIEARTATLNGNISADVDIIARGFVYSTTTTTPTLDNDSYVAVGSGIGDFIYDVTDLTSSTTYNVRAYATTFKGTFYGDVKIFATASISVPIMVDNILVSDRNAGSSVPTFGVALNYTNDSDHANHKNLLFKGDYYTWNEAQTACVSGWRLPTKDEFAVIHSKMQFSDGRAYLTDGNDNRCYLPLSGILGNSSHVSGRYWSSTEYGSYDALSLSLSTSYSSVSNSNKSYSFSVRCVKTQISVTTKDATNIEATTATFNGNITTDLDVTARGFVYSTTTTTPILDNDSHVAVGYGAGDFTFDITNLTSATSYNVRAYSTTSKGTFYGDVNIFTTSSISVPIMVDNILISDRNVGSSVPIGGLALNYTNDEGHTDHTNLSFKGDYHTWDEAQIACASGWRLPSKAELDLINSKIQFSDGRAYLTDANGNRCYFPLSGYLSNSSNVSGGYWSSTESLNSNAWILGVNTSGSSVSNDNQSNSFSVRCVKTVL